MEMVSDGCLDRKKMVRVQLNVIVYNMHSHSCCSAKQRRLLSLGDQICEGLFQSHE